jgi:hypothetical protein
LALEDINSDLSRLWLLMTLAPEAEVGDPRGDPIRGEQGSDGYDTIRRRGDKAPAIAVSGNLLPCSSTNFVLAQRAFRRTNRVNKRTTCRLDAGFCICSLFIVIDLFSSRNLRSHIQIPHGTMRPQGLETGYRPCPRSAPAIAETLSPRPLSVTVPRAQSLNGRPLNVWVLDAITTCPAQPPEACRQIGRLIDDCLLLGRARTEEIEVCLRDDIGERQETGCWEPSADLRITCREWLHRWRPRH